ncbi:MAG: hypothetical protein NTY01_21360 [Verrucomicrobia bacterium]|nr:hypothetical protein [Verrucomicrobiota bacterium]
MNRLAVILNTALVASIAVYAAADDATQARQILAAYRLDSPPVFDGMIAANARLFVATMDGKVLCLGSEGKPLPPASDAKLGPVMETSAAAARASAKRGMETMASHPDSQHLAAISIAKSDLGYRLRNR